VLLVLTPRVDGLLLGAAGLGDRHALPRQHGLVHDGLPFEKDGIAEHLAAVVGHLDEGVVTEFHFTKFNFFAKLYLVRETSLISRNFACFAKKNLLIRENIAWVFREISLVFRNFAYFVKFRFNFKCFAKYLRNLATTLLPR
jgi:hypothetical protein